MHRDRIIDSPLGKLLLEEENNKLVRVHFMEPDEIKNAKMEKMPHQGPRAPSPVLDKTADQITGYFLGELKRFNVPFDTPGGTEFQRECWKALGTIPFGETRTYGWIAEKAGHPKAARAVGQAMNRNPLALVLPCHRVIGSKGEMTGFGPGIDKKRFLLDLEDKE